MGGRIRQVSQFSDRSSILRLPTLMIGQAWGQVATVTTLSLEGETGLASFSTSPFADYAPFSASNLSSIASNFVVVLQLRMVMDLYSGAAAILLSRLLVRCALRRCE